METNSKVILKKIAAVLLVPIDATGVYVFSLLGSFGAWISMGQETMNLDVGIVIPILGITIALIIVIPIIQLIDKAAGKRWQAMLRALFLLGWYLVGGGIVIAASIFVANHFDFFENDGAVLVSLCRVVSASLAIGYYFYFKKIIKPLALK